MNTKQAEVESKLPDLNILATKDLFNKKTKEFQSKMADAKAFITTPEFD